MSLFGTLSVAKAGMAATQARAQTASSNIANVNTPGYVRRETNLGQLGTTGITVSETVRVQDQALTQSRRDAQSQTARSEVIDTVLTRTLSEFGNPGDSYGVFGAFTQFESDLQTLKATPESLASQAITVDSLKELVRTVADASANLQSERTTADAALAADIDLANQTMESLYEFNADIAKSKAVGQDIAPLLDERDRLLDQLSELIPYQTRFNDNGTVNVTTQTGLTLVGATVRQIEFEPANRVGALDTNTDNGGRLSIPTLDGHPIAPGSGEHGLSEGRIAANLEIRDTIIPEQAARLDDFAYDFAAAFDAIGQPLLLDSGSPIDALNKTGLSERLSLNPLIDPVQGGSGSRLRDGLAATITGPASDDTILTQLTDVVAPFSDTLSDVINETSSDALRAQRIHTGNVARMTTISDAVSQFSSVDLDFELQNLLAIEQAYTANARVVQTVSDMLDTLARL